MTAHEIPQAQFDEYSEHNTHTVTGASSTIILSCSVREDGPHADTFVAMADNAAEWRFWAEVNVLPGGTVAIKVGDATVCVPVKRYEKIRDELLAAFARADAEMEKAGARLAPTSPGV